MLTFALLVFGFVLIACIALLFLAAIAVGELSELSHGWFLGWADKFIRSSDEVFANDVVEPDAGVKGHWTDPPIENPVVSKDRAA
jgi:hypothetical protein